MTSIRHVVLNLLYLCRSQRFFRNTVQEWGFQSFYVASAVCYISSAIFVKVNLFADARILISNL